MKKIYKYTFEIVGRFSIMMPNFARILSVQVQKDKPCIWALIDDKEEERHRSFSVIGTGHNINLDLDFCDYVGTFQLCDGALVWHLFDLYYPEDEIKIKENE